MWKCGGVKLLGGKVVWVLVGEIVNVVCGEVLWTLGAEGEDVDEGVLYCLRNV